MSREFNDYRAIFVRNRISQKLEKVAEYTRRSYADRFIGDRLGEGKTVFVKYVQGGRYSNNAFSPIWFAHLKRSDGSYHGREVEDPKLVRELQEADIEETKTWSL